MAFPRSRYRRIKNAGAEAAQFRSRAFIAMLGITVALLFLGGWYFRLQVLQHDDFATRSEENRLKLQPIVPGRGLIYDRKGRILADNVPAWRLDVTPSEAGDPAKWLPALTRLMSLAPEDIERFEQTRRTSRGFKPITLKLRASPSTAGGIRASSWSPTSTAGIRTASSPRTSSATSAASTRRMRRTWGRASMR